MSALKGSFLSMQAWRASLLVYGNASWAESVDWGEAKSPPSTTKIEPLIVSAEDIYWLEISMSCSFGFSISRGITNLTQKASGAVKGRFSRDQSSMSCRKLSSNLSIIRCTRHRFALPLRQMPRLLNTYRYSKRSCTGHSCKGWWASCRQLQV